MRVSRFICAGLLALAPAFSAQAGILVGTTPYLSFADSPFASVPGTVVDDLEDGQLNLPGLSVNSGWFVAGPGVYTDSVGTDNPGGPTAGHSLYSGGTNYILDVRFDKSLLGGLFPTYTGLVFTDLGNVWAGSVGYGSVLFEAFDASGNSIGNSGWVAVGNGTAFGSTADDRFFGATHAGGISRFTMTTSNSYDWEVDHFQYSLGEGTGVPTPAPFALFGIGLAALGFSRRRV